MKEIAEEINKLVVEINQEKSKFETTLGSFTTKGEAISHSFNFIDYTSKIYAFRRFYPFCKEEDLSKEAIDFYNHTVSIIEQSKSLLENKEQLPEELKKFLNKKRDE